jgi:hypothetical protein
MIRANQFKLLSLFADGKPHGWIETINLGTWSFLRVKSDRKYKTHQQKFEQFLNEALEYGLIKRVETEKTRILRLQKSYVVEAGDFAYQITAKGDESFRNEAIAQGGDSSFYKTFDRTSQGFNRFSPLPKGIKPI